MTTIRLIHSGIAWQRIEEFDNLPYSATLLHGSA
jgi:hypothetical protein